MHWIDLTIMAAFLIGCMAFGYLARGKTQHAEDYFTGGGKMTGFLNTVILGLSIAGTFFSGISFIIYPSIVYSHSIILPVWGLAVCMPLAFVILRFWFLPRYLAGKWKYPYEILEDRFGPASRTVASLLYICMRIGWMGAMIYAPTLAIITMCGLDLHTWFWPLVLANGLTNTFFTVFVGIRGVVVIEAVHMLVIAGGILATIISALYQLPVPFSTAISTLYHTNHFKIFDFSFDPRNNLTVFSIVIGTSIGNLVNYIADQMSLQRYLASGDGKSASRSFVVNIIGVTIVISLLTAVGLALYVFYHFSNESGVPAKADQVFPHFVSTHLPVGVAGLLLAALLSANSLPAAINTLSSILTVDFHSRLIGRLEGARLAFWAKVYSSLLGVTATLLAGSMAQLNNSNLFELTNLLGGMFAGPLLSVVVLATLGVRSTGAAIIPAIVLGWLAGVCIHFANLAPLWIGPASALTTLLVGFGLSRFIKASPRPHATEDTLEIQAAEPTPVTATH